MNQKHYNKKHYHVLSGLSGGYMPNTNYSYETEEEAFCGALELVRSFRDYGEHWKGRKGYYYKTDQSYYIETVLCHEEVCEEENDY